MWLDPNDPEYTRSTHPAYLIDEADRRAHTIGAGRTCEHENTLFTQQLSKQQAPPRSTPSFGLHVATATSQTSSRGTPPPADSLSSTRRVTALPNP